MPNLNIYFSEELHEKIKKRAAKSGRSMKNEIIKLIDRFIDSKEVIIDPESDGREGESKKENNSVSKNEKSAV